MSRIASRPMSRIASRTATAPGKVMLAGEYAVLDGAEAVLAAVDRRVRAHADAPERPAAPLSPFLAAVADEIAEHAGASSPAAAAARRLKVDSSALKATGGIKLGLGSSAAVCAAAAACALGEAEDAPAAALIHRIAHRAHGRAQAMRGARGSGADVAACVHGGLLAVRRPALAGAGMNAGDAAHEPMQVRPLGGADKVALVFVWTGSAADTPSLIQQVKALARRDPAGYERALADIAAAAQQLIAALRPSAPASAVVAAVDAGARAAAALGDAAGVALETATHRAIAALARAHGGAAKPTGAGAGDLAVAAFAHAAAAQAFSTEARSHGLEPLDLAISAQGAHIEPGQ